MRIPFAILMLCLPMAAMGETYICKEQVTSFFLEGTDLNTSRLGDWVIDMDSGYRPLTDSSDYRGSCQKLSVSVANSLETRINCSIVTDYSSEQILMHIESGFFTHSLQFANSVSSSSGKCTGI